MQGVRLVRTAITATLVAGAAVTAGAPLVLAQDAEFSYDRVLVCPDTSGSLDGREYEAVLKVLHGALADLLVAVQAKEIALLPWAESVDAWRSPRTVRLPTLVSTESEAPAFGEAEFLFKGAKARAEGRVRAANQARLAAATEGQHRAVGDAVRDLLDDLVRSRLASARCTALSELLLRCGSEAPRTLILIVTDGQEVRCSDASVEPTPTLADGVDVVLILLPGKKDDGEAGAIRRERVASIQAAAPWLAIVPSFRVAEGTAWLVNALGASRRMSAAAVSARPGADD